MIQANKKIRVLVAKPGLDGHDVGAKVLCRALLDAGMDTTYTGLRKSPAEIAQAALDANAEVLGLSILSGAHLHLSQKVMDELRARGIADRMLLVAGGNIPASDHEAMRAMGFAAVFATGTPTDEIVEFIERQVER